MLDKGTRDRVILILKQEKEGAVRERNRHRQKGGAGHVEIRDLEGELFDHATATSMYDCAQNTLQKAIDRISVEETQNRQEPSGIFEEWRALDRFMQDHFPGEHKQFSGQGLPASQVAIILLTQFREAMDAAQNAKERASVSIEEGGGASDTSTAPDTGAPEAKKKKRR